ncbi:hypothetical protein K439DRAFT_1336541 [Ramaria rubella]|nr:hypothetical protein K439DRAFT_1336541 [Ramaria rubella]
MISTITQWLQYPKEKTISAAQGKFVNMLLTITNSYDIFLLNATWKAYYIAKMCRPFGAISKNSNPNTLATMVAEFVQFLRDLMPTTQSLNSQSSDNNLIHKVIERPDFYMPFWEIAPSRHRVTGPQGPFEHNFIRTRSGLFSALIYRGITYTAAAESDPHNNHFEDLNAYISYCCNNQFKGVNHFRNMTAYGTPNHKRHPKLAITFWKATEGWETFIKSNQGEIAFNAMHEQKIFPQIGDLTSYLMVVDLCYTGLVQWPTACELGELIYDIGRGSYSEMVVQGLIDGESDCMDCGRAFRDFNDKVSAALTSEELEKMNFDIFMMEHALCKRKRLRDALQ